MKLTDKQKSDIIILMGGFFLCEEIPDDWEEMDDDEFFEFIRESAWEPFEYWEGEKLFQEIESAASQMIGWIEQNIP